MHLKMKKRSKVETKLLDLTLVIGVFSKQNSLWTAKKDEMWNVFEISELKLKMFWVNWNLHRHPWCPKVTQGETVLNILEVFLKKRVTLSTSSSLFTVKTLIILQFPLKRTNGALLGGTSPYGLMVFKSLSFFCEERGFHHATYDEGNCDSRQPCHVGPVLRRNSPWSTKRPNDIDSIHPRNWKPALKNLFSADRRRWSDILWSGYQNKWVINGFCIPRQSRSHLCSPVVNTFSSV